MLVSMLSGNGATTNTSELFVPRAILFSSISFVVEWQLLPLNYFGCRRVRYPTLSNPSIWGIHYGVAVRTLIRPWIEHWRMSVMSIFNDEPNESDAMHETQCSRYNYVCLCVAHMGPGRTQQQCKLNRHISSDFNSIRPSVYFFRLTLAMCVWEWYVWNGEIIRVKLKTNVKVWLVSQLGIHMRSPSLPTVAIYLSLQFRRYAHSRTGCWQ